MISGRALIAAGLLCAGLAGIASADAPPVVIAPFQAHCFDANALAVALRAEQPELAVHVGGVHDGARQEVRVEGQDHLVLHIVARGADGREIGREQRTLPDADCATLLEAAELIVARAATPLRFRNVDPQKRGNRPHPTRSPSVSPPPSPPPPQSPSVSPPPSPPPSVPQSPSPPSPPQSLPQSPPPSASPSAPTHAARPKPARRAGPPSPARLPLHPFEIDLGAQWIFPLEGQPSTPLGELAVGLRLPRHLGIGLRAGVAQAWTKSVPGDVGTASVAARRVPLAAELRVDVPVWRGGFRFSGGPNVSLWLVRSEHVGHPGSGLVVEPGAELRVAYRFEISRFILEAAVQGDVAFGVDRLSVTGVGTVARTPRIDVGPALAAGVRL